MHVKNWISTKIEYFNSIIIMRTLNQKLINWVNEWAELCQPEKIHWCDGSQDENKRLLDEMTASGMCVKLNEAKRPNSYYFQSDPSDVAPCGKQNIHLY